MRIGLPDYLRYHTLRHTLEVCHQSAELAAEEGVTAGELQLLLLAAAYHDCGYLEQAADHEAFSCAIAREILPAYGYSNTDLETICSIILATRLPQNPLGLLEQIICDADLDYLGRADFFERGELLYQEWLYEGVVKNEKEWNVRQVDFLKNHHYFTATAIAWRAACKAENLGIIQQKTN